MNRRVANFGLGILAVCLLQAQAFAAAQDTPHIDQAAALSTPIALNVGHSTVVDFPNAIDRASINNTEVADVVVVSPTQLLVHAKQPGSTSLIVWRTGENSFFLVSVAMDVLGLDAMLKQVFPKEKIEVRSTAGTLILGGDVSSLAVAERALSLAQTYAGSENVVNMLQVKRTPLDKMFPDLFPNETIAVHETPDGIILTGEVSNQAMVDNAAVVAKAYNPNVTNFLAVRKPSMASLLKEIMPGEEDVSVHQVDDTIILSGTAKYPLSSQKAEQAAAAGAEHVVNLIDVPDRKQVMLEVRFAEVKRSIANSFGIDYFVQNTQLTHGRFMGNGLSPQLPSTPQYSRLDPADFSLSESLDQFLELRGSKMDVGVALKALQEKGLIRILAEPNLVAMSGEEASFLAGGEFPIPVVQSGGTGGGSAVTIEFKEFGIRLSFKPDVQSNDTIRLHVEPEVSLLDFATAAVSLGGFEVPGLVTRRANTNVQLKDGESLVIGGLLSQMDTQSGNKVPFLGNVPVIGQLFSSKDFQNEETELIVLVTPHIVNPTDLDMPEPYPNMKKVGNAVENHLTTPPYPDERGDAIRDAMKKPEEKPVIVEPATVGEDGRSEGPAPAVVAPASFEVKPEAKDEAISAPKVAADKASVEPAVPAQAEPVEALAEPKAADAQEPAAEAPHGGAAPGFDTSMFSTSGATPGTRPQSPEMLEAARQAAGETGESVEPAGEPAKDALDKKEQEPQSESSIDKPKEHWRRVEETENCDEKGWEHHNSVVNAVVGRFVGQPCDDSSETTGNKGKQNFFTKPDDEQWFHPDSNGPVDGNLS